MNLLYNTNTGFLPIIFVNLLLFVGKALLSMNSMLLCSLASSSLSHHTQYLLLVYFFFYDFYFIFLM